MSAARLGRPRRRVTSKTPGGFDSWHDLYREYYAGLAEHLKKPRGNRGNYLSEFCEKYDLAAFEIHRLQKPYRIAYLEQSPHQEDAKKLFERFLADEFGPDRLRVMIDALLRNNDIDPEVYRKAMSQVGHHLAQIRIILEKLPQDIPAEISDEEVKVLSKEIWFGRRSLTSWYNDKIRKNRPNAMMRNRLEDQTS